KQLLEPFKAFFENPNITKVGQNLKYDIKVLSNYEIKVEGPIFDTMIAHYLIDPDMRHQLDILAETYLNYKTMPIKELNGKKGKNQGNMRSVSLELQTKYAVENANITLQLATMFEQQLKQNNAERVFTEIESPLVKVLSAMEIEGIGLNTAFLNSLTEDLNNDLLQLEQAIYSQAGEEFNIASPKQLGPILFDKLKLVDKPKKTKTGQYS